jgi:DNA repair photolyase
MRNLFEDIHDSELLDRIDPKYRPVWMAMPAEHQQALAKYFLPHRSVKPLLGPTRPRVIKWYCPFACQRTFPSGHRYCINVYTGCAHQCVYCYAACYQPVNAHPKKDFGIQLRKDLCDLEEFDVPAAPLHISNSTDPFQPLEEQYRHTKLTLEQVLRHRRHFTTVTILTKNPLLAARPEYVELLQKLMISPQAADETVALTVEVSLAFANDVARQVFDPAAPSVADRMQGIRLLRNAGIPVVLRIDPLFPRSPIADMMNMSDFGLPELQTLDDLDSLAAFAAEVNVHHIVYSTAKIVLPRSRPLHDAMRKMKSVYQAYAAPDTPVWHSGSYRLPHPVAQQKIIDPFLALCKKHNLPAKFCKQNLLETS